MSDQLVQVEAPAAPVKNLNLCFSRDIRDHFPFPVIRPKQESALRAIEMAYRENKKFIIIEAPTGIGKSGVAIAAASYAKLFGEVEGEFEPGAYILSPQKTLTEQYLTDFAAMGLVELKGRANYTCATFNSDCETGGLLCRTGKKGANGGNDFVPESVDMDDAVEASCDYCPYKEAKRAFCANPLGVTNFAYYLSETMHAGQLKHRHMLVLDEGHNTENMILSLADTEVNKFRCDSVGLTETAPVINPGDNLAAHGWLFDTFRPAAVQTLTELETEIENARENGTTDKRAKLAKKYNGLKQFLQKVNLFLNDEDKGNWFCWSDRLSGNLLIRPLTATLFAHPVLFDKAEKVLIMSATILDFPTVMRNLGIRREDAVCVQIDSDFPAANRPIFYKPQGNMSFKTIAEALPKVQAFTATILSHKNYTNVKGIVHTHSYKLNEQFVNFLSEKGFGERIVTHVAGLKGDRENAVERHCSSELPTVLFSPSMTEGLDLKDDLSRFSVVVKVPYPYLDPYVKARMERDPDWYTWLTVLALIQALGRSNRHIEDKAHHYILDEGFKFLYQKARHMFPNYIREAIRWPNREEPKAWGRR